MLVDPAPPLKAGERVPLTLTFERAGVVEVQVEVEPIQGGGAPRPALTPPRGAGSRPAG